MHICFPSLPTYTSLRRKCLLKKHLCELSNVFHPGEQGGLRYKLPGPSLQWQYRGQAAAYAAYRNRRQEGSNGQRKKNNNNKRTALQKGEADERRRQRGSCEGLLARCTAKGWAGDTPRTLLSSFALLPDLRVSPAVYRPSSRRSTVYDVLPVLS